MIVLTASTKSQFQLAELQRLSCGLCGVADNEHVIMRIPEKYPRHPSWFKVRALLHNLPNHDYIIWMDSDATMIRRDSWLWFNQEIRGKDFTCAVAKDVNGWNCGVMVWRQCPEAFEFLWNIYDSYEKFALHPWQEQGALHTMAESFDILELPKKVWNAYESDRCSESLILHLPGKSHDHRMVTMYENLEKLRGKK